MASSDTARTATTLHRGRGSRSTGSGRRVSRQKAPNSTDTTATRRKVMEYAGWPAVIGSHQPIRIQTLTTRVSTASPRSTPEAKRAGSDAPK